MKATIAALGETTDVIKPLQLATVSSEELRLQSLFPPGATFTLDLDALDRGETQLSGYFVPAEEVGTLPYQLHVTLNQFPLELRFDQVLMNAVCQCIAPDLPVASMPPKLVLALLQSALAPLLHALGSDNQLQIHLLDYESPPQDRLTGVSVAAKCSVQDRLCWLKLTLGEGTLGLLEKTMFRLPAARPAHAGFVGALPLALSVRLRGARLSRQEIRGLELYDIVLLDPHIPAIAQHPVPVELWTHEKCLFTAHLLGANLQIDKLAQDYAMSPPSKDRSGPGTDPLADIPMDVVFEVSRQVLTLEQLKALAPGQVFALDKSLQSPVTVYAQGVAIAEAELVQIQDRVGARITRLLIAGGPSQPSSPEEPKSAPGKEPEGTAKATPGAHFDRIKDYFDETSDSELNEASDEERFS